MRNEQEQCERHGTFEFGKTVVIVLLAANKDIQKRSITLFIILPRPGAFG